MKLEWNDTVWSNRRSGRIGRVLLSCRPLLDTLTDTRRLQRRLGAVAPTNQC